MIFIVLLFFIAIVAAFGVLSFRAWELRTGRAPFQDEEIIAFEFSFRKFEQAMLYYAKHIIQGFVLGIVKYWFIAVTKAKKWLMEKWPKVHSIVKKKALDPTPVKPTFLTKALMESKSKIKRIKQKIREEHDM